MENSYVATGTSITVPISDYHFVDNLERSPAVMIVHDGNIMYHIPTGVNTECQLEYINCCEHNAKYAVEPTNCAIFNPKMDN